MSKSATADFDAAAEWTWIVTNHEGPGAIPGFLLFGDEEKAIRDQGSGIRDQGSGIRDQQ
jgi:hypothetical protein